MPRDWSFFPEQASTLAGRVDNLYLFLIGLSMFFGLLISALIAGFAIKYRRRSEDEQPPRVLGSLKLELFWTAVPLVLVVIIFLWGARLFVAAYVPPDDAMEVFVTGKQWMWKIQHPNGKREINELHVPTGQPIKLTMTSQDVIHSFYIPAFRIKRDVVPGMYTTMWFEATKPGSYHLFCAEYCGTDHSRMRGQVVVMTPADYETWLAGGGAASGESMADAGQKLFQKYGCVGCHSGAKGAVAPDLKGVFGHEVTLQTGEKVVVDESYVRESILEPRAKMVAGYAPLMPTFAGQLGEEEITQLIAYIKSLSEEAAKE